MLLLSRRPLDVSSIFAQHSLVDVLVQTIIVDSFSLLATLRTLGRHVDYTATKLSHLLQYNYTS
jgi:hypothetical protein